ncbi:MAG: radical SAM protein [Candidatus Aminicenantes bacterium]|nr:radical SAM protein [Candidatus Aminicenantes bacterium]
MPVCLNLVRDDYVYMCDYNQVINAGIKDLFLEHGAARSISIKDVDIDEQLITERIKKLPQLIFEATENCNLRCKYCAYGGAYLNQRALAPHNLNFETARKGLDYIYSFIKERKLKEFNLSFYGGEPLLNFKTIQQIAEYGKKRFNGWLLRFNLTTNLTLLDNPMLDYLVENNFSLLVSLDGDKKNHDAKRVFRNGRGSHNLVMKNLQKIKKRDQDYFDKKIAFSAVYSRDLPLKNLHRFFTTDDLIKNKQMRFSHVNTYNTTYYDHYPFNKTAAQEDSLVALTQMAQKVREGEKLTGYETSLYNNLMDIGARLHTRGYTFMAGSCLFDSRLYLDVHGRFHICEKMNNTFSFGDIEKGFDLKKMTHIAREFMELVKTHCSDCRIRFLCNRCYSTFCGDGKFKVDPVFCENQEETITRNLEKFIESKEEGLI